MKWLKHDSRAHQDPKLVYLRMEYGMEGYGLYWYLLEQVAAGVGEPDFDFILDPDTKVVSYETRIDQARVTEMLDYMIELGLFSRDDGVVSCPKMLERMDSSMISNPQLRKKISQAKAESEAQKKRPKAKTVTHPDGVMTHPDGVTDQPDGVTENRDALLLDKIRFNTQPRSNYSNNNIYNLDDSVVPDDELVDPDAISGYHEFITDLAGGSSQ